MPNSALLFTANDGTSGTELWVTDGTSPGTFLLKDINPGAGNSNPGFFVPLSTGSALFSANNGTDGPELWVSNGTPSGTTQIADIRPGSAGSNPAALTEFAPGRALFSADDGTHGSELWTTDGTAAGTSLIMDITPGATSGGPSGFMVLSPTQVLFGANDGIHGGELWTTDGTAAGTSMLAELRTGTSYGNPAGSYPGGGGVSLGNGKAVFTANNGANGRELWVSDGTVGGTALLADIIPGAVSSYPNALTPIGNGLALFTVNDGTHDTELWVTDGTVPGTHLLKDINTHPVDNVHYFNTSSYPRSITAVGNGLALFRANDVTHGYELWITDGTEIGTTMVADINGGALDSKPGNFVEASNGVYLMRAAGPASYGFELWRTDGTEAGTTQVTEIFPGSGSSLATNAPLAALGNGQVVFPAGDGVHGTELWVTDGTSANTSLLKDIKPGTNTASSAPSNFTLVLPCFRAGTRILTTTGERAVEMLAPGMAVPTASGRLRRIVWIGRTEIDLDRHPAPERVGAIRIAPGAFAPGAPHRALFLSPDHAVAIDGALVPIHLLVNGTTITREATTGRITWLHVELDAHDILLAEGLATESYLDTGNRNAFANNAGPTMLHPDFGAGVWHTSACALLLQGGPTVTAARDALAVRAAARSPASSTTAACRTAATPPMSARRAW